MAENFSGHKLNVLRIDNGGKYTSTEFESYRKTEGIRHERTIPKTPEQNRVAERKNRTLVESVRSICSADAKLPHKFGQRRCERLLSLLTKQKSYESCKKDDTL